MNRVRMLLVATAAAGATLVAIPAALAGPAGATAASTWGTPEALPDSVSLNVDNNAIVQNVSCTVTGDCVAAGYYADADNHLQPFIAQETNGQWGDAGQVPGLAALNAGNFAQIVSVSCPTTGDCAVVGYYTASNQDSQAFVVDEAGGVWGDAEELPGVNRLGAGTRSQPTAVSCPAVGQCAVVGSYNNSSGDELAFVSNEVNGAWHAAQEMPGSTGLHPEGDIDLNALSCGSAGNCTAGGMVDQAADLQAFTVSEVNGKWKPAAPLAGTAALDKDGGTGVGEISCTAAGSCSADGVYRVSGGIEQFVATETSGKWAAAKALPGLSALNTGDEDAVNSLSCASPGNCTAAGYYETKVRVDAFVADQVDGKWAAAIQVPASQSLATGGGASIDSVSCFSAGNCVATGDFLLDEDGSGVPQAMVDIEVDGTWAKAEELPGVGPLSENGASVLGSVSCASSGYCSAGGEYFDGTTGDQQTLVDSLTPPG